MKQFAVSFVIALALILFFAKPDSTSRPTYSTSQQEEKLELEENSSTPSRLTITWKGTSGREGEPILAPFFEQESFKAFKAYVLGRFETTMGFNVAPFSHLPKISRELVTAFPAQSFALEIGLTDNDVIYGIIGIRSGDEWTYHRSDSASDTLEVESIRRLEALASTAEDKQMIFEANGIPTLTEQLGLQSNENFQFIAFTVHEGGSSLQIDGDVHLTSPLGFELEEWNIPEAAIHDPLISFTAAQGLGGLFLSQPLLESLVPERSGNQFFSWVNEGFPFLMFAALPVKDAASQLKKNSERIVSTLKARQDLLFSRNIRFVDEGNQLMMSGYLPVIHPFIRPSAHPDYALAGIIPIKEGTMTNPPPAALLKEIRELDNLVFYDWELSKLKLETAKASMQILSLLSTQPFKELKSPLYAWLDSVGSQLGNTTTTVSASSNTQLHFKRRSRLGLSALEWVTLGRWLESDSFPRAISLVPFLPLKTTRNIPQTPLAPVPPAGPTPLPRATPL